MKIVPAMNSQEIVALRPQTERPSASDQPLDVIVEAEAADKCGRQVNVLSIFLRGGECAFRCLMCDLWKSTTVHRTPENSLVAQVDHALQHFRERHDDQERDLDAADRHPWIKLYNASNFFSSANVPTADLPRIAARTAMFERVIVENHPKILNDSAVVFRDAIGGQLEVALGLETACEKTLAILNKQMTLDDYRLACDWLLSRGIDLRTFVLLRPPGMSEQEGIDWCVRSVEFAHGLGVRHISIIPTRAGNGALDRLAAQGLFEPPLAHSLEVALRSTIDLPNSVITADLWDWRNLRGLDANNSEQFHSRIVDLNRRQRMHADSEGLTK